MMWEAAARARACLLELRVEFNTPLQSNGAEITSDVTYQR